MLNTYKLLQKRTYTPQFFSHRNAPNIKSGKALHSFFVTPDVINFFRENNKDVVNFVNSPKHQFFYTETCLDILNQKYPDYPEAKPNHPESYFRFVSSKLVRKNSIDFKNLGLELLIEYWPQFVKNQTLTSEELEYFKAELFMIFEAGYGCHQPDALPRDDYRSPPFLTCNTSLLEKFISHQDAEKVLEQVINNAGMEHLIPLQSLAATIEAWGGWDLCELSKLPTDIPTEKHTIYVASDGNRLIFKLLNEANQPIVGYLNKQKLEEIGIIHINTLTNDKLIAELSNHKRALINTIANQGHIQPWRQSELTENIKGSYPNLHWT